MFHESARARRRHSGARTEGTNSFRTVAFLVVFSLFSEELFSSLSVSRRSTEEKLLALRHRWALRTWEGMWLSCDARKRACAPSITWKQRARAWLFASFLSPGYFFSVIGNDHAMSEFLLGLIPEAVSLQVRKCCALWHPAVWGARCPSCSFIISMITGV